MACTYNSVTLAEGDSFVLPPGATLIAATVPGNLTSENDCAADEIANLETFICYSFRISGACDDNSQSENWEPALSTVLGISVSGVFYPFGTTFSAANSFTTTWSDAFNSIPALSNLFSNFTNNFAINCEQGLGGSKRGWTNAFTFATIPSIGDNLEIVFQTTTTSQLGGNTTYSNSVIRYDDWGANGDGPVPECSLSLG